MTHQTFFKKNKYNAVKQTYGGYNYDSRLESNYAADLDLRLKAGEFKSWDRQKTMRLEAYGKHICNYRIDFVITHHDDTLEYVEVKGFETDVWRIKWKLFEAMMAEIEPTSKLTIVK